MGTILLKLMTAKTIMAITLNTVSFWFRLKGRASQADETADSLTPFNGGSEGAEERFPGLRLGDLGPQELQFEFGSLVLLSNLSTEKLVFKLGLFFLELNKVRIRQQVDLSLSSSVLNMAVMS